MATRATSRRLSLCQISLDKSYSATSLGRMVCVAAVGPARECVGDRGRNRYTRRPGGPNELSENREVAFSTQLMATRATSRRLSLDAMYGSSSGPS